MIVKFVVCFIAIAIGSALAGGSKGTNFHEYCVIGAGPAGLQMGYFLQNEGRDYVIFERGPTAGTFYTKYPIHRNLISINKRYTGKTNKEFNLRHDWNSLLSHDESLLMTKYTKDFFPHADVLVKYLNDYATKLGLNVQYNTEIRNLTKRNETFYMNNPENTEYSCKYVIMATGIAVPNQPKFKGSEYTTGYEDLTLDLEDYEGKSVLIIGRGNSAFEVAQHIIPATNYIHMTARTRVKLAWATHYVGDVRAVNDGLLDTYQLKSLDGLFEAPVERMRIEKSTLNGRYYIHENDVDEDFTSGGILQYKYDNDALREGYDLIIRCLGFTFDFSIFDRNLSVPRFSGVKKKYPRIRYTYESTTVPNLFFAGANTHSLDFRKSAGAFIHGYRYTTRTLHRLLEWRNHGIKWPSVYFHNLLDFIPHMLKRINEASDIYQMFGVLCEVIIYNEERTEVTYLEAVPCALTSNLTKATGHEVPGAITLVVFEYGKNFSGPGKDPFFEERATGEPEEAHQSNFLHPVLYYFNNPFSRLQYLARPQKWVLPVPDRIHHIVEDFTTKFDAPNAHILPLRRFIESCTGQDLRFYYAQHCMMMAMTKSSLPLGCRHSKTSPSSNYLIKSVDLKQSLQSMPGYLLPFVEM